MAFCINSFNGGYFSSYLRGRPELEKYHNSLQAISNFHLLPYGALQNRAGTYFVTDEQSTDMRLITFQYNINQSYALMFFNNKIKIVSNDAVIGSGGVAGGFSDGFSNGFEVDLSEYFLSSPWTNDQIHGIQFHQEADTMWLVHPDVPPQKLVRNSETDWSLTEIDYAKGPFLTYNLTSTTITPSATSGTGITLTASGNLFSATDVDRSIELKQIRTDSTTTASSASYSPWIKVKGKWDFSTRGTWTGTVKIYRRVNGGTQAEFRSYNASKDNNYIDEGDEKNDGVEMRVYGATSCTATLTVDDFFVYGVAKITAYTSPTRVTANILVDCDATTATADWAFNAFSEASGYPTAIALWNERMCLGGTLSQPNKVFLSKVDEWENFQSSNSTYDAMSYKLNTSESIRWMEEQGTLVIGTSGNEYKLAPLDEADPLAGDNVKATKEGAEGSSNVQAITVSDVLVFVARDTKKTRSMSYSFEADKLKSQNLNALAGAELLESGIRQVVYKQNPYSELYLVLNNGTVALMTYDQEQNIYGWSKFDTDGQYKSACVLKGVDTDTVYFAIERTISGVTSIFLEKMEDRDKIKDQSDWFFVDCGLTGEYLTPTNTVSGLAHLEGETVAIMADGGNHPSKVVTGGEITLDRKYSKVNVGLPYISYAQPMSTDVSDGMQSNQNAKKKMSKLEVKVKDSVGMLAGPNLENLERVRVVQTNGAMGTPLKAFTGVYSIPISGRHKEEYAPYLVQDKPQPLEILGFVSPISIGV